MLYYYILKILISGENMKFKNILLILSYLLVVLICITSVSASLDDNLTADSSGMELGISDESGLNELSLNNNNSILSASKTIVVDNVGENHNEMNDHTIRNAIQSANAGDTILIDGNEYVHCHIVIDKQLTIKSTVGTRISSCSNMGNADSGHQGMFYLTSKASGTVIEGFNFNNDDGILYDSEGYAILIRGASNVIIRNCTFSNGGYGDSIRAENANNILIQNVNISDARYGVNIINSSKATVSFNNIKYCNIAGVEIAGTSSNPTIINNNITNNNFGVELTSSDNINILSNYIGYNNKYGVYVNCYVKKVIINGNYFRLNELAEVFNSIDAKNIWVEGGEKLEVINNNYMVGHDQRAVYRTDESNFGVFLGYVFEVNENVACPVIHYTYGRTQWSDSGYYYLMLSNITQVKKGIYSISIVDANGNIAKELGSVPVIFYLNKVGTKANPQEGDVYRTVIMQNGTATARFYQDEFNETGNVITAVFPTDGANFDDKVSKTFAVDDAYIPGTPTNTTLTVSNLNTYPKSNEYLIATLKDNLGNPINGEQVVFTINSKSYTVNTDANGQAKQKIYETKEGTFTVNINYAGDDVDYLASSAQAKVVVKKISSKIISSNLNMIPKMAEYYSITLKDASGNAIGNQKVTFKVNGKTYTKKTNSKGVAKVKLKFNKNKKTYKITIKFTGSNKYKAASKTNTIKVKYSSKTAKITAPSVTITPKTSKTYTVTLKDSNGKAIVKQKLTINVNGKTYTKMTNSKGQTSVKVKFSSEKTYKVSVKYAGSKIYKKASATGKIKVAKTTTSITAPTISNVPIDSKNYTVTLKANNKALSKQKLTITLNGKTYTKTTDSKGQVSISISLSDEKTYSVTVNYKGTTIYKASKATGKIIISKLDADLGVYNRTFSKDSPIDYKITLKDESGNAIGGQEIKYAIDGANFTQLTDENGQIKLDFTNKSGDSFEITASYDGNYKYNSASKTARITIVNETGVIFVDSDLPNSEIQDILDSALNESNIEFLGDYYFDIALSINKPLNIYSNDRTILNAKADNPTLLINSDDVNVTNFVISGNSGDAVVINNADNIVLFNNSITNNLDESKIPSYVDGSLMIPGYGVSISNSTNVKVYQNNIEAFESGIFAEYSSDIVIDDNVITENNYGIKYGFGVANTQITNNEIRFSVGLIIMTVPEGPTGYGIYLNNSAVNVTINKNHIYSNFIGISLDANYSTGIVITQNTITDQVLEGIRFNAGYDLAENAVEPHVTDNAIYRNARGPSMMILGEMSANPAGIYGPGEWNASLKLKIEPNWYGTNQIVTWDNDTGYVGYGTMCPRINTSEIKFNNITFNNGSYEIVFYKNGIHDSNLPEFDLFATLNWGSNKAVEVNFNVVDGVGSFSFNSSDYNATNNTISITVATLIESTSRVPKIIYYYEVPQSEIPA